jgi:hypothetical protein
LGQNGTFFNKSLLSSTNRTIPDSVVNALYNTSDHLPILTELSVNQTNVSIKNPSTISTFDFKFTNPVFDNLKLSFVNQQNSKKINISIISILGKEISNKNYSAQNSSVTIPFNSIQPGIYFVKVIDEEKRCVVKKFIKK